jgi:hypothetical protein
VAGLHLTTSEWREAIAPYNFENQKVQVDDPETAQNIVFSCEQVAKRRKVPAATAGTNTEVGREVILMRQAMLSNKERIGKSFEAAASAIRSLEGRIAMLEMQLQTERGQHSELKDMVLNLRSSLEELRSTPRLETQNEYQGLTRTEPQGEAIFSGEFDGFFENTWS